MRTEKLRPCSRFTSRAYFAQIVAQLQRRVAGALGVVLVGDRRAEQRHDAVAGVLVDGALEAMHALREDAEEPRRRMVCHCSGSTLLGECHRALHVGEEHRDLLALAFEGGLATVGFCRRGAWECRKRGAGGALAVSLQLVAWSSATPGTCDRTWRWAGCRRRTSGTRLPAVRCTLHRRASRQGSRFGTWGTS